MSALILVLVPMLAAGQFGRRGSRMPEVTVPYNSHFTFTRIRYGATLGGFGFGGGGWEHDYPQADRNFSAILDYISNARVQLQGSNILDLDDPRIFENPVIYMSEPGYWTTNDAEIKNLRPYLLKGGFIIFDDFEGDAMWRNMVAQMKRVVPELTFVRLDVTHPIFHTFFNIQTLDIPHPTVNVPPGFYGLFENDDPSGRMLAIANWNNDIGDYWEWSAENLYGSDPTNDAYRLGVNYVIHMMTH